VGTTGIKKKGMRGILAQKRETSTRRARFESLLTHTQKGSSRAHACSWNMVKNDFKSVFADFRRFEKGGYAKQTRTEAKHKTAPKSQKRNKKPFYTNFGTRQRADSV